MNEINIENKIYLVATPIGNLADISYRALEVLKNVDIIAAEDTRNTLKLLNHFDIKKPLTSYHEYNKVDKAIKLIEEVQNGKSLAVCSDAGMPAISDPGEVLVKLAYESGVEVTAIPGACALVCALAISGRSTKRFCFEGFLPSDKKEKKEIIDNLKNETRTIILYEAPHRLLKTLKELNEVIEDTRDISLCKEISKRYETVIRNDLKTMIYEIENELLVTKGEYVIVIEGKSKEQVQEDKILSWQNIDIKNHLKIYEDKGMSQKDAMKQVAKDRGISKRDVYCKIHIDN